VNEDFYSDTYFFRVLPNFVAQFGINGDPAVQKKWKKPIVDDPVLSSNKQGTITFATSGKNTRTTQLFINYKNNKFLDSQGFAPFGEIMEDGMEIVNQIFSGYGEQPKQNKIQNQGNSYLKAEFPKLTYIKSMEIVEDESSS